MKKGTITITITIGLMFFVLSTLIFIQFKTISSTDIIALENMRDDQLNEEIITLKAKYEETASKIIETENKINEYKETMNSDKKALELLKNEVKETEDLIGKTDVSGERNCNCSGRYKKC